MRLSTLMLSLACFGPAAASAGQPAPQAAPQSAEVASLAALPPEIRAALGEMADRGGPFAAGCISLHGEPHSRFAGARVGADSAEVTVERGGIAHFFDQRGFRKVGGHWVALPDSAIQQAPVVAPQQQQQQQP